MPDPDLLDHHHHYYYVLRRQKTLFRGFKPLDALLQSERYDRYFNGPESVWQVGRYEITPSYYRRTQVHKQPLLFSWRHRASDFFRKKHQEDCLIFVNSTVDAVAFPGKTRSRVDASSPYSVLSYRLLRIMQGKHSVTTLVTSGWPNSPWQ